MCPSGAENARQIVCIDDIYGMEPVETQWTIVGKAGQIVDTVEVPAVTTRAQCPAPSPVEAEEQPSSESPVDTSLQRIVIGGASELVHRDVAEAGIRSEEVGVIGLEPGEPQAEGGEGRSLPPEDL